MSPKKKPYIKNKQPSGKIQVPQKVNEPFSVSILKILKSNSSMLPRRLNLVFVFLFFILGFLFYANTLLHDYALDDDLVYKLNSTVKKGIDGIPEIFRTTNMYGFNHQNFGAYRPFTQMIFALEYQFFGLNPHMQHLLSVLMFAITMALLYLLMKRMFRDRPFWIPFAVTLIFLAHPIHTEVVANIKSGDELISFLFGFVLVFLALFRYIDTKKIVWLVVSLFLFLLGLMSKEHIITLIPIIPLTLYFFTDRKPLKILFISLWFLIPVAVFAALRWSFIESYEGKIVFLDNFIIHIPTFVGKYGTILFVMLQYLRLSIFPFPQSCDYSWAQTHEYSLFSIWPIVSAILYLGIFIIAILLFKKKNLISWCILFFLCSISMYSHIYAGLAATMAERFLFLPSLPFIIALVLLLDKLSMKRGIEKGGINLALWPLILIFFVFGIKTISRNTVWKNSDTLFLNDVENAPNSARMNKSAGDVYINTGKDEKDPLKKKETMQTAMKYLQKAYTIYPEYPDNLLDLGTAWYYLGEYDTAWVYWSRFSVIQPWSQERIKQNFDYMKSGYYMQGQEFGKLGKNGEAVVAYNKSLQFDTLFHPSWFNLGLAYAGLNKYGESKFCIEKALKLDSTNADYWYNYGGLLFTLRDIPNARMAWQKTLKLNPNHAEAQKGLQAIDQK
jgi:protein O-mannosyl-transferase